MSNSGNVEKNKNDEKWFRQFELLKEYVSETKKFPSSSRVYKETKIGQWCRNQKIMYENGVLSPERIALLDEFSPLWRATKEQREAAYRDYVFVSCEWKKELAEDDVAIDKAFSGDSVLGKAASRKALYRCVDRGIYSCRAYLENRSEWGDWQEVRVVFETQFPNLTYAYFNLWRAVDGWHRDIFENAADLNSKFSSRAEMNAAYKEVLGTLTPREQKVLICRFFRRMSLEDIGWEINATRERVRQIEAKSCRKLRGTNTYRRMSGCRSIPQTKNISATVSLDMSIEELSLSVRSFNCLRRANIKTIGDIVEICKLTEDDWRTRMVGRKSMEEVLSKIEGHGFSLAESSNDKEKFDEHEPVVSGVPAIESKSLVSTLDLLEEIYMKQNYVICKGKRYNSGDTMDILWYTHGYKNVHPYKGIFLDCDEEKDEYRFVVDGITYTFNKTCFWQTIPANNPPVIQPKRKKSLLDDEGVVFFVILAIVAGTALFPPLGIILGFYAFTRKK